MTNQFSDWLAKYDLSTVFITNAGDGFYANKEKMFGVIQKNGEFGVHSFYLDDIVGFQTYDDEKLVTEWNTTTSWRILPRNTSYSTNEVYMKIFLRNGVVLRLQIFRATHGNIRRDSADHVNLLNYACQISQIIYNYANNIQNV